MLLLNSGRFGSAASPSLGTNILADGAVLYMPFTEGSVAPVDATGTHTPTVPSGGVSRITDGPLSSSAYRFAGTADNRVAVPDHNSLDLGDTFTMECYYRPVTTTGTRAIMGKGSGAYLIRRDGNNLQFLRSQVAVLTTSTVTINDTGHWYHIMCTKSGSTVKMWIDGVDVTGTVSNSTCANNTTEFAVGVDILADELPGDVAHVALYPTALSAAQVAAHYACTTV